MAIDMFQEFRPDVCTLDLVMPEFDGMHALRGIKAIDPDAKVVVVSALEQKNVLKDTFSMGASDFIVKPFQQSALINTLESLIAEAG
jgi:two-component system chemotaxis response regulator CheY